MAESQIRKEINKIEQSIISILNEEMKEYDEFKKENAQLLEKNILDNGMLNVKIKSLQKENNASGYNTHKNYSAHDDFINEQCSFHAEMDVLRKIYWRNMRNRRKQQRILRRTTLYISRYSNTGNSTNSAPCAKCLHMIQYYKIRKIVFNLNNTYYEYDPRDYTTNHKTFGDISLHKKK